MRRADTICLGRDPKDGTLRLIYLRQRIPTELIARIGAHLKGYGYDRTLSHLGRCAKRIHKLTNPILYRRIILTAQNAHSLLPSYPESSKWQRNTKVKMCEPLFPSYWRAKDLQEAYGTIVDAGRKVVHYWMLTALIERRVSRWDGKEAIMRAMMEDTDDEDMHNARRVIYRRLGIDADRQGIQIWTKQEEDGLRKMLADSESTLRGGIENAMRISNLQLVEKLDIHDYPLEEEFYGFTRYVEVLPVGLRHRILPMLRYITIDEGQHEIQRHREAAKRRAPRIIGYTPHDLFGYRNEEFGRALRGCRPRSHLDIRVIGTRKDTYGQSVCTQYTLENLVYRRKATLTLHGWQPDCCVYSGQAEGAVEAVRYYIGAYDIPREGCFGPRRSFERFEELLNCLRDIVFGLKDEDDDIAEQPDPRQKEATIDLVIGSAILAGSPFNSVDELAETFFENMYEYLEDFEHRDKWFAKFKRVFSFVDASDEEAEDWEHLCRDCDACGGECPTEYKGDDIGRFKVSSIGD